MAEINVERKRRSILPLVLGVLALAALLWLLFNYLGRDDNDADDPVVTDTVTLLLP
ncbi:MAG TPA: hypothetical protein VFX98_19600 [Longimicrobiaceae bacterium]|nr:hypothetical protein [Longimicrobiaceae bacterium]